MESPALKAVSDGVQIAIKVVPRASRTEIVGPEGAEIKVRVAAPPVDDAANTALLRFLADTLDVPKNTVKLARGASSRHKLVTVSGLSLKDVHDKLHV